MFPRWEDPPLQRAWILGVLSIWPLMVIPGFVLVQQYANKPGRIADPPQRWPQQVSLPREAGTSTLVMLAHPRCPCTRASLRELARLMAELGDAATATVLFVDPTGEDWEHTDLWEMAEAIPTVRVLTDEGGQIAATFGAYTSGQVLVYDTSGQLVFNGGITSARGHEGDNAGHSAIREIVSRRQLAAVQGQVFGCDLAEPERAR
jgi:hypothetical protein